MTPKRPDPVPFGCWIAWLGAGLLGWFLVYAAARAIVG